MFYYYSTISIQFYNGLIPIRLYPKEHSPRDRRGMKRIVLVLVGFVQDFCNLQLLAACFVLTGNIALRCIVLHALCLERSEIIRVLHLFRHLFRRGASIKKGILVEQVYWLVRKEALAAFVIVGRSVSAKGSRIGGRSSMVLVVVRIVAVLAVGDVAFGATFPMGSRMRHRTAQSGLRFGVADLQQGALES